MPSRPWIPKFLKDLLDISPLINNANGKFLRYKPDGTGPEFIKSSIVLYGLDNGSNLPGIVLQAEIDDLINKGTDPDSILWFSTGTE